MVRKKLRGQIIKEGSEALGLCVMLAVFTIIYIILG